MGLFFLYTMRHGYTMPRLSPSFYMSDFILVNMLSAWPTAIKINQPKEDCKTLGMTALKAKRISQKEKTCVLKELLPIGYMHETEQISVSRVNFLTVIKIIHTTLYDNRCCH